MLTQEQIKSVVERAKDEAGIYYDDDDKRLTEYAKDAYNWIIKFNDYDEVEIGENSIEFTLLAQRVRYQYNNYLDEFENNYAQLINEITLKLALRKEKTKNAPTT